MDPVETSGGAGAEEAAGGIGAAPTTVIVTVGAGPDFASTRGLSVAAGGPGVAAGTAGGGAAVATGAGTGIVAGAEAGTGIVTGAGVRP